MYGGELGGVYVRSDSHGRAKDSPTGVEYMKVTGSPGNPRLYTEGPRIVRVRVRPYVEVPSIANVAIVTRKRNSLGGNVPGIDTDSIEPSLGGRDPGSGSNL